jgi:hypothetical protein
MTWHERRLAFVTCLQLVLHAIRCQIA